MTGKPTAIPPCRQVLLTSEVCWRARGLFALLIAFALTVNGLTHHTKDCPSCGYPTGYLIIRPCPGCLSALFGRLPYEQIWPGPSRSAPAQSHIAVVLQGHSTPILEITLEIAHQNVGSGCDERANKLAMTRRRKGRLRIVARWCGSCRTRPSPEYRGRVRGATIRQIFT